MSSRHAPGKSLVQFEVHREVKDDIHRLAVQRAGFEFPTSDRVYRGLIESEGQRLEDLNVGDGAALIDDALYDDDAGNARLAAHFRIDRFDPVDDHRPPDVSAAAHRGL